MTEPQMLAAAAVPYRVVIVGAQGRVLYPSEPMSREQCLFFAGVLLWMFRAEGARGWELVNEQTGICEMDCVDTEEAANGGEV